MFFELVLVLRHYWTLTTQEHFVRNLQWASEQSVYCRARTRSGSERTRSPPTHTHTHAHTLWCLLHVLADSLSVTWASGLTRDNSNIFTISAWLRKAARCMAENPACVSWWSSNYFRGECRAREPPISNVYNACLCTWVSILGPSDKICMKWSMWPVSLCSRSKPYRSVRGANTTMMTETENTLANMFRTRNSLSLPPLYFSYA